MSLETVQAIAVLGNAKEVERYLNHLGEEEEVVDMCEALQEMIRDGERIGEARGEAKAKWIGIKALIADNLEEGVAEPRIVEKLQKHFMLTQEEAVQHLQLYHQQESNH